jgi:hypothetical protein
MRAGPFIKTIMVKISVNNPACNCIDEMQEAILKKIQEQHANVPGFKIIKEDSGFDTVSYLPQHRLFVQFNTRYTRSKSKTGVPLELRPTTKKTNIFFTYCPFCGIKLTD